MNIRFLVVFSLLFATLLPSVAFPSKTVVVMIDLSDSTESQRDDYHKYFDDLLATIESGDKLVLMQIALAPTGGSVIALHQEYPGFSLFENRDRQRLRQRQLKDEAVRVFAETLQIIVKETPILDTLLQTERLFASFPNDRRAVVIFSDMQEYSAKGLNFVKGGGVDDPKKVDAVLNHLAADKRLPSLNEVEVYVAGARHQDTSRFLSIKNFWKAYFSRTGARLCDYGPELLLVDRCAE